MFENGRETAFKVCLSIHKYLSAYQTRELDHKAGVVQEESLGELLETLDGDKFFDSDFVCTFQADTQERFLSNNENTNGTM